MQVDEDELGWLTPPSIEYSLESDGEDLVNCDDRVI